MYLNRTPSIKFIVGRARPKLLFLQGDYGFSFWQSGADMTSFPSGHATTSIAIALSLAVLAPKIRYPIVIFGALLAATRIVTAAHYFSDVFAGAVLALVTVMLLEKTFARYGIILFLDNHARPTPADGMSFHS